MEYNRNISRHCQALYDERGPKNPPIDFPKTDCGAADGSLHNNSKPSHRVAQPSMKEDSRDIVDIVKIYISNGICNSNAKTLE